MTQGNRKSVHEMPRHRHRHPSFDRNCTDYIQAKLCNSAMPSGQWTQFRIVSYAFSFG